MNSTPSLRISVETVMRAITAERCGDGSGVRAGSARQALERPEAGGVKAGKVVITTT